MGWRNMDKVLMMEAKKRRKQPSPAEALLWEKVRNYGIGQKTRRQHPLFGQVVDFYLPKHNLAIEIDSSIGRAEMRKHGVLYLFFTDEQVLQNVDVVIQLIKQKFLGESNAP